MADTSTHAGPRATRKNWVLTTWADSFGIWHCQITNPLGWEAAGDQNIGLHISALRSRARRAISREIRARQAAPIGRLRLEVAETEQNRVGRTHSITFKEWSDD